MTTPAAFTIPAQALGAACANVPVSEPLTAGEAVRTGQGYAAFGSGVRAEFAGEYTGHIVLLVDDELSSALNDATEGELDLMAALTPVIRQILDSFADVALGTVAPATGADLQETSDAQFVVVPLNGQDKPRAVLAFAMTDGPAATDTTGTARPVSELPAERLDLLRGVEMVAATELGRAKMTVNDLLSLRDGVVIELDRPAGSPADLYINGRLIARGEIVVADENYALRVTQVLTDDINR